MRLLLCALVLSLSACEKSDLDKHRGITNRMLTQRGAPDFVDASTPEIAAIRHTPSGMVCVLPADGAFEFDVFPADSMNAGAQCSSTVGDVATAWVVVSFSQPTTLDAAFASANTQLSNGLQAQPWDGRPSEADRASPDGLPHYRIQRVRAQFGEESRYMRLSMAEMDGWYLQQISSAPIAQAREAETQAGAAWRAGLRAFAEARRDPAPATN
ncbi:MAG: hypothetical protein IPG56_03610 [Caulobacteraceae bacterium]|nr:hypothetical protein [Caulobacteraceae bacterium]